MNTREQRNTMMRAKGYIPLADAAKCAGVAPQTMTNWITPTPDVVAAPAVFAKDGRTVRRPAVSARAAAPARVKGVKVVGVYFVDIASLRAHLGPFMFTQFDACVAKLALVKRVPKAKRAAKAG